jgi:hypothetical protein
MIQTSNEAFRTAIPGYGPSSGDPSFGDLGAQLAQLLTSARAEADELRTAAAAEVSRATRILEEASRTADLIIDEATRHATARRAEAEHAAAETARAAATLIADAERRAGQLVADAERRAGQLVADAAARADRIRSESERELADATRLRDSIGVQLTNVRQLLATLTSPGSGEPAGPTADLQLLVSPRPAAGTPAGSNRPRSTG